MSMSCRHRNVVVVGSHETGASSAHCGDCRAPLARRIEGGEYIYVEYDGDRVEVVYGSRDPRRAGPAVAAELPAAIARERSKP